MPFGLTNAPASFQSLMNKIFQPYLRKFILVFFDDILIHSPNLQSHVNHLRTVLEILRSHQLYAKMSKCMFAQLRVEYLGHVISYNGVEMDAAKVECIRAWPVPATVKALRGFLGLTGYYRRFVQGYGQICKPLTELLRKDSFCWTESAAEAFQNLKDIMSTTPVLRMPDFTKPFVVETDACSRGIGAVLMQEGQPIAYLSKALSPKNLGLSIYEKELLAVVMAVTKWKHYLLGYHFVIKTDHQSLRFLLEQRLNTPLQHKCLTKLLGLDHEIQYKKGAENKAADALSRKGFPEEDSSGEICAITCVKPQWLTDVSESYEGDSACQDRIAQLLVDPTSVTDYEYADGVLRFRKKIYVGSHGDLRHQVIQQLHCSAVGGHSGQLGCFKRLGAVFYWPRMRKDVADFVKQCDVCQRNKHENVPYPGLLQPLLVPNQAWSQISMDFIESLPLSEGADTILVVVDRLTKLSHFIPLKHPFSAVEVAKLFLTHVFRLHGLPEVIVSDRDKLFTSLFWQELFRLVGTRLNFSSAYHPQTDGQSERVNQCLETYLRCMTSDRPQKWKSWLPLAEWWYNTNYHTSLQTTPFEALYGYKPNHLPLGFISDTIVPAASDLVRDRQAFLQILRQYFTQSQQRMKYFADRKRSERALEVVDMVYLKLQPYRQQSVEVRRSLKLASKYYGPFPVIAHIGEVAYRLELPQGSRIHPVFHISMLKKKVGGSQEVMPALPLVGPDDQIQVAPEMVLKRRAILRNQLPVSQVLIKWINLGFEEATWEDLDFIKNQFPEFHP